MPAPCLDVRTLRWEKSGGVFLCPLDLFSPRWGPWIVPRVSSMIVGVLDEVSVRSRWGRRWVVRIFPTVLRVRGGSRGVFFGVFHEKLGFWGGVVFRVFSCPAKQGVANPRNRYGDVYLHFRGWLSTQKGVFRCNEGYPTQFGVFSIVHPPPKSRNRAKRGPAGCFHAKTGGFRVFSGINADPEPRK